MAILLLIAYAVGWGLGYAARRLSAAAAKRPAEAATLAPLAKDGAGSSDAVESAPPTKLLPDQQIAPEPGPVPVAASFASAAPVTAAEALSLLTEQMPLAPPAVAPLPTALEGEDRAWVEDALAVETRSATSPVAAEVAPIIPVIAEAAQPKPAALPPEEQTAGTPDHRPLEPPATGTTEVPRELAPPMVHGDTGDASSTPTIQVAPIAAAEPSAGVAEFEPPASDALALAPGERTPRQVAIEIPDEAPRPYAEPETELLALTETEASVQLPPAPPVAGVRDDQTPAAAVPKTGMDGDQPTVRNRPAPQPASQPGVPWAGEISGQRAVRFAQGELPPPPPERAAVPTPLPSHVEAELFASVAESLTSGPAPIAAIKPLPPFEPVARRLPEPTIAPVAEAVRLAQAAVEQALAQASAPEEPAAVEDSTAGPVPSANEQPVAAEVPRVEIEELRARGAYVFEPPEDRTDPGSLGPAPEREPMPSIMEEHATVSAAESRDPLPSEQEPVTPHFDESAAMRAIEGGWSRRASRAMPDAPELADVSVAVSAAQVAVEQVLVQTGVDPAAESRSHAFGKPKGLPGPRGDGADNLREINGLSALDESTLHNLGIFHFDQVAAWGQKEVLWLENHAFARGRISREDWQAQARRLAAQRTSLRASR